MASENWEIKSRLCAKLAKYVKNWIWFLERQNNSKRFGQPLKFIKIKAKLKTENGKINKKEAKVDLDEIQKLFKNVYNCWSNCPRNNNFILVFIFFRIISLSNRIPTFAPLEKTNRYIKIILLSIGQFFFSFQQVQQRF